VPLVQRLNDFATGGLKPDLVLILDLPAEEGLKRIQIRKELDRLENEKLPFHKKVRSGFRALAKKAPRYALIDASGTEDEVAGAILKVLQERLKRRGLWKKK